MAKHIYSTLSADTRYADWIRRPGLNSIQKSVLVRGGSGIALMGAGQVYTPDGIRTEVSDEDAEFLANHSHFKEHQERGFVRIEKIARDADKVAQNMETDSGSAPKTPEDVKRDAEEAAKKAGLTPDETLQVTTNKKGK